MTSCLLATTLALLVPAGNRAPPDTTFTVTEGTRLEVNNRAGAIQIRGIDGDRVRVDLVDAPPEALLIQRHGSVVRVTVSERWRASAEGERAALHIEVPRRTDLWLQGVETEIEVVDIAGAVDAETVDENVTVEGPARSVRGVTTDGSVSVTGARGPVDLYSMDGHVVVEDIEGSIRMESVDGDLVLHGVRASRVEAGTTDGEVFFEGQLEGAGIYSLSSHYGNVWMATPRGINASFVINVRADSLDAGFDPPALEAAEDGFGYRLVFGNGAVRVELSSFRGRVLLRRPDQMPWPAPAVESGH